MTHYLLLGVTASATKADLDAARRKLALQHHPDHGGDGAKMAEINVAYDVLVDPARHKLYRAGLLSTLRACAQCGGKGVKREQRGFTKHVLHACTGCGGAGLVLK